MKHRITLKIMAAAILVLTGGCDRYIDSSDPVRSLPEPGPVPYNLTAALMESAVVLTWEISDPAAVKRYRVYAAPAEDTSDFILRDSTGTTSIVIGNLPVNQQYYFQVAGVSLRDMEFGRSETVTARVLHLSIAINGGNEYTPDRDVQVRVSLPSGLATHIQMSENPTLAGSSYQLLSGTAAPFTLSDGDGTKRVYARVQFEDGTETANTLADSIILDTYVAVDSVFFSEPEGNFFTTGETIRFGLDGGETGGRATVSFTGAGGLVLVDDGTYGDPVAGDGIYHYSWTVPPNFSLNGGVVTGSFTDRAGNLISQRAAAQALNIFAAPLAVTASASAISNNSIELTWTQSVSSYFASYKIYRSNTPAVTEASTLVTTIDVQATTSFTNTGLAPGTTYYYRVYVRDQSGLSTGSAVVSARTSG